MKELDNTQEIINVLKDLKVTTGRMGRYETDMVNLIIKSLQKMKIFTEQDMHLAFFRGSRILYDNNSLEYLENYKKFMKEQYDMIL
ncbi:MAG: hypothetical protein IJ187_10950 [Neisseriaceae bacterium]|nr:hypothetical protein [Neisseriaceae bacterium]